MRWVENKRPGLRPEYGQVYCHPELGLSDRGHMMSDPRQRDLGEIRTDLALEAHLHLRDNNRLSSIPGVRTEEEKLEHANVSRIHIFDDQGERYMGKKKGHYITIEAPALRRHNPEKLEKIARTLADELERILPLDEESKVLVVGLGNWNATPDALGPKVVSNLLITRHLKDFVPETARSGLRSVAAMTPGVLGLTGIETGEIIQGIVERIRPSAVIAVDALASRSIDRILTTIQIADTGINPGSGVGNFRQGINRESLNIPVIALGVPTVVHAQTIAHDTLELVMQTLSQRNSSPNILDFMSPKKKLELIDEVLSPTIGDLMVTPKEIDVLVEDMSRVIAAGINAAMHPRIRQMTSILGSLS